MSIRQHRRCGWIGQALPSLVTWCTLPSGLAFAGKELAYCGLFLGTLARLGAPAGAQVAVTSALFAAQHVRYLLRGAPLTFTLVAAFGVIGAPLTHTAMNTLIFVFIGGRVSAL